MYTSQECSQEDIPKRVRKQDGMLVFFLFASRQDLCRSLTGLGDDFVLISRVWGAPRSLWDNFREPQDSILIPKSLIWTSDVFQTLKCPPYGPRGLQKVTQMPHMASKCRPYRPIWLPKASHMLPKDLPKRHENLMRVVVFLRENAQSPSQGRAGLAKFCVFLRIGLKPKEDQQK